MDLPVNPPVKPMLAKAHKSGFDTLPDGLFFEPKWDGFRCIIFRDGDEVLLGSRNERPLTRYFPEILDPLRSSLPGRCVVDGEIVVVGDDRLEFDWLQQRLHPAESRVNMLAEKTPAEFVAFDLLAEGGDDLMAAPFVDRRARLEAALASAAPPVHLTPITNQVGRAADWFDRYEGAGLDGVIAKAPDLTYQPDKRVMFKVKHQRTADCVVAGFRTHKSGDGIGSLLLGLYDEEGGLHHVGVAASFTAKKRVELVGELDALRDFDLDDHPWADWIRAEAHIDGDHDRMPGAPSRWNATKDMTWTPLRPERVIEVTYDFMQGNRFRTVTRMVRWRPDRDPGSCTYAQLDTIEPLGVSIVLAGG
ncbi:MAG TPA: ATP-dependent DNA ligase [Acidimicrobiales bacterium]|nr:ATP-dependent DNA ligase [Acidimicrobiales bacterium]